MSAVSLSVSDGLVEIAVSARLTPKECLVLVREIQSLANSITIGRASVKKRFCLTCVFCNGEFVGRRRARFCTPGCAGFFRKEKLRKARMALGSREEGTVHLTQGLVALVSPEDWDRVSLHNWYTSKAVDGHTYVQTTINADGRKTKVTMHRFVMDMLDSNLWVDHINGNGLDNRRENLRPATPTQNGMNKRSTSNQRLGRFKGVREEPSGKWSAQSRVPQQNGPPLTVRLGSYLSPDDAARAYDAATVHFFGDRATPNFPDIVLGPHNWHRYPRVIGGVPC